jgi:hypothetical protein
MKLFWIGRVGISDTLLIELVLLDIANRNFFRLTIIFIRKQARIKILFALSLLCDSKTTSTVKVPYIT